MSTTRCRRRARRSGLRHAGYHALNSLRIEKAYRHWGHDITGRGHAARGRPRLRGQLGQARRLHRPRGAAAPAGGRPTRRLVQFLLEDPGAAPLSQRADLATASDRRPHRPRALYGHTLGAAVALGYVETRRRRDARLRRRRPLRDRIAGERFAARASLSPMYDQGAREFAPEIDALTGELTRPNRRGTREGRDDRDTAFGRRRIPLPSFNNRVK